MVDDIDDKSRISFQLDHVITNALVETVAIMSLNDIVHMVYELLRKDTREIACIANGLHLVEHRKGTDYDIGGFEVLTLHKRTYIIIVPLLIGQH